MIKPALPYSLRASTVHSHCVQEDSLSPPCATGRPQFPLLICGTALCPTLTMTTICSAGHLTIRAAEETDIPLIARWRSDPRVIEFYSGRDRPLGEAGVRRHYFDRSDVPPAGSVHEYQPCVAEVDERPIGFVQFYRLRPADSEEFGYRLPERTFGLDLFIGDPSLWGQGFGTLLIILTVKYLATEKGVKRVVADPRADNPRSIRALEKAGFRRVRKLPAHEKFEGALQDCWLMEYP